MRMSQHDSAFFQYAAAQRLQLYSVALILMGLQDDLLS